jgi:monoamine oxidase
MVLSALSRHLRVDLESIERACVRIDTHDWQSDPYSRGAYSYHRTGGEDAMRTLAAPVANTLFFAGEAVDLRFQNGTVHGAISSGLRAAHLVYASTLSPLADMRLHAVH